MKELTKKAVFLDRDGVINHSIIKNGKPYAPRNMEEFVINPEIIHLNKLKELGYLLIITTNQPDVANKIVTKEFVCSVHDKISKEFIFDEIMVCFHKDSDQCECRKPKAGMLFSAQKKFSIDMTKSYMIGDRWRDIGAGKAANCHTILIDYSYKENNYGYFPDHTCKSLSTAIDYIVNHQKTN